MEKNCLGVGFKMDVVNTMGFEDSFVDARMLGYIMRVSMPITTTIALANVMGVAIVMGQKTGINVVSFANVTNILSGVQKNILNII
jgi:fructose-1-phosphate kinase PfkB-like protein